LRAGREEKMAGSILGFFFFFLNMGVVLSFLSDVNVGR
jgi:hypothetical protein